MGITAGVAHAGRATCSNPGLPVGAGASGELMPGRLTIGVTSSLLPASSTQLLDDQQGPVRYESDVALSETRLAVSYAALPWLAIEAALPFRVAAIDVTYRDPDTGEELPDASAMIHARDETLRGLGDPSLAVHLATEAGGWRVHARAGTSLPTGGTVEDPFALGAIGQEHQHVQFGTGTFVPMVAAEVQRPIGRHTLALWSVAHASLYENHHGYHAGSRISAGLNVTPHLGLTRWSLSAAAEVHGETAETWGGRTYEDEGNAGRVDVMLGGAAAWRPVPALAFVLDVKVPVVSRAVGPQLEYPIVLGLGLVASFDLRRKPSWRGLDRETIGAAGTAPDLAPVAGKLTVVDLWASWCAPCAELERGLVALARRFPARLAVRTLDVVDTDSAGWTRYLEPGGFSLPHVKVYGPDGALRFERTAPPDELLRAIEAELYGTAQVP